MFRYNALYLNLDPRPKLTRISQLMNYIGFQELLKIIFILNLNYKVYNTLISIKMYI